jgi:arginine utilization protein RocB
MTAGDIAASARDWAIWLTRQPSVTGTQGEQALPAALAARLASLPRWQGCEIWTIPAQADPLQRECLAVLARGQGDETLLLTGHFDTVSVDDYGDLKTLATDPERLAPALLARLATPANEAEALARDDLAKGLFLPGRGLLDMKAGLAAALAGMEAYLAMTERRGNLLFVAVPDEEVTSVGARALAGALGTIAADKGLTMVGAINLDCIGDIADGTAGRAVALGSVGKLLATALVVGVPTHASHPCQGLNAAALAGELARRIEWAPELADSHGAEAGIPPTLLSLKDAKRHYDVTTPDMAFATWNILTLRRGAGEVLAILEALVGEAIADFRAALAARRQGAPEADVPGVPVIHASALLDEARAIAGAEAELSALASSLAAERVSLPDQNERLSIAAWRLTGRRGPAVIIGFGSLPYPSVLVSGDAMSRRLSDAIDVARAASAGAGVTVGVTSFFPGISDMSFIGEADTAGVALTAANTPAWTTGVRWNGQVGGVPTVNIGPWGRDYHTPLERVETSYAFGTLPRLLLDVACARFGMEPETTA